MKRLLLGLGIAASLAAGTARATVAPADGGRLPDGYYEQKAKDPRAYTMKRAWIQKARRLKTARLNYVADAVRDGQMPSLVTIPGELAVGDTLRMPVVAGWFSGEVSVPYPIATLDNQLFLNNPSGTVTDYYHEVSYGAVTLLGTVMGWTQAPQTNAYYAGTSNGTVPGDAHTGEFIKVLVDAHDGSVDFGQFDNDGPDGLPNSGDDDGYVDVLAVVHSRVGGECNLANGNIQSHQWSYSAWPVNGFQPYVTNDPAAGGGFIRIDDYAIMPAKNCFNGTIEIGVFCHEFGHAFGLPDLYDGNGGPGCTSGGTPDCPQGIGHWGIMGAGNWNSPSRPAHPTAWTRMELGWVAPSEVDWQLQAYGIDNINQNPQAHRLAFTDERFRRMTTCAIGGAYSLYCGLTAAEASAQGWPSGGYGSNWTESIEREFTYDGNGPVVWSYDFSYDLEVSYDFAYAIVDVGGEQVVAAYDGIGNGTANIDITSRLATLNPGDTYTLRFRVESDFAFDDSDGNNPTTCGALVIDNVSVTGGGESYSTDFETNVAGWFQDPIRNPSTEYWLIENRRALGFDENLHNQGLVIYHIDEQTLHAPLLGNRGGDTNTVRRGMVIEEADGLFNLNVAPTNRGEASDVFPGSLNRTSFTSATNPNTDDNTNRGTLIEVTGISAAASTMSATMRAGDPAPQVSSILPNDIDNDQVAVDVTLGGSFIRHGATFYLTSPTPPAEFAVAADSEDIIPLSIEWVDTNLVLGVLNVYSKTAGYWDLVVTNPDGQTATLNDAVLINYIVATKLVSASTTVADGSVELTYVLREREAGETLMLYRSLAADRGWELLEGDLRPASGELYTYVDATVEPGRTYYYLLVSESEAGTRELHRSTATIPAREIALEQNVPNPFNPETTIRYFLPERTEVSLAIYDVRGALVRRLATGEQGGGAHVAEWDGTDERGNRVGSGIYVYRLIAGKRALSRKMILLK